MAVPDDTGAHGPLRIEAVAAFRDNYIWLMARGQRAVAVDPGDAVPVMQWLAAHQCTLDAIVVTHHHADHVGGVAALVAAHGARVLGPARSPFTAVDVPLRQGDAVELLGERFSVLEVPGHTLDHIAYWSAAQEVLFCGDTLFACGCGRLFEGTAAQMFESLTRLAELPPQTRVYCAHEYTAANIRFARAVEPDNAPLLRRAQECAQLRERGLPTVPSTLGLEVATNPFLRCAQPTVRAAARRQTPETADDAGAVFAAVRRWKDTFAG